MGYSRSICILTGTNLIGVVKEVLKGTVVQYGKCRLATFVIGTATYSCAPAVAVITNAKKGFKACKVVYTTLGFVAEAIEYASHVAFVPIDLAIFGQPIPANTEGRFSSWSNVTDLIDELPDIGSD